MQHPDEHPFARALWLIVGWLASVTLADVQLVVSIISGVGVLIYTAMQAYVLWRDKIGSK